MINTPVSMAKASKNWCLTSTETIRLIRDGEKVGEGGVEVGGRRRVRWLLSKTRYKLLVAGDKSALSLLRSGE